MNHRIQRKKRKRKEREEKKIYEKSEKNESMDIKKKDKYEERRDGLKFSELESTKGRRKEKQDE